MRRSPVVPPRWVRRREEHGSVALIVVFMLPLLLAVIGFSYDANRILAAKVQASDVAAEAARAGAAAIAPALRGGAGANLDPAAAVAAADNYLAAAGYQGAVRVNGSQVSVTVSMDRPLVALSVFGVSHAHVDETSVADAEAGINRAGG